MLCVHLEGWDREGGREMQEGGDKDVKKKKKEGGDMGIYVYV